MRATATGRGESAGLPGAVAGGWEAKVRIGVVGLGARDEPEQRRTGDTEALGAWRLVGKRSFASVGLLVRPRQLWTRPYGWGG
ncbi:hypothetical protein GCM10023214_40880 [Amycolatopsis dongchuanensis]|uniref:Uncharacterized protein n=1 Tax=Amycolatopsis dongchuanensis TaxID=1070866 RepID=A0ABP9QTW4_9PSEU